MENLPVTLIVKAPNQQIEDQTVRCELSWTINKLKQHLSEVYPNKPAKHEQKLIYSGQLLNDTQLLKDVLRQYEGQETHTVHLVCKPKREPTLNDKKTMPSSSNNSNLTAENINNSSSSSSSSEQVTVNQATNSSPSDTGIPNMQQNFGNMGVPWMPEGMQIDPQYAAHMAVMQQAYIQYINQYMQLAASSYGNSQMYSAAAPGAQTPPEQQQYARPPQFAAAPQPPAAAQPPQQQQLRPPQAARDPELAERDWLDNFYLISRLLVLFSVVFFYSSFLRFALVLILGTAVYLYQVGFFRQQNNANNLINNNNNVGRDARAAQAAAAAAGRPAPDSGDGNDDGVVEEDRDAAAAPSRLTLVWTFFTTFFASLLPEVPNAV